MRPRPSREWVIAELERHGVRIVAGRRGTSDNAILYKKNATSAARAASIVAHAAVSAAHEQHANSTAAAAAAAAVRARATATAQNPAMAAAPMNHHQIGVGAAAAGPAASAALFRGHPAATTATAGAGMGAMGASPAAAAGVAAAPMGSTAGIAAGPGAGAGTPGAGMAGGAASASGLRESFTAELGGERSEALAAARRDSLGALFGEGGMMKRRTSLDSLGFAASLLSSGALDALGEMDELETSALRRDIANASAVDGDMPPPGRARRNSSLDLVRFLKSEIGIFDDEGAAGTGAAGAGGGVPGSISISAGGGAGDHGAFGGATTAGSVMQRRLSNAALQMSLGLGGLSRGIGLDELVASSNPTPGAAGGSAVMSRSASAMLGAGPLGGLGSGSSALAAVSGLGPNATPTQHYEMLKLHHMNLLQEIQETTMMMNLYQQQMLQEQQEQLEQEQLKRQQLAAISPQIGTAMHQQIQANQQLQAAAHQQQIQPQMQADAQQPGPSTNIQLQPQKPQQQQQQQQQQLQLQNQAEGNPNNNYAGQQAIPGEATDESAEESIRKLRAEIAERERKMQEITSVGGDPEAAATNNMKRRVGDHEDEASKRAKMAV